MPSCWAGVVLLSLLQPKGPAGAGVPTSKKTIERSTHDATYAEPTRSPIRRHTLCTALDTSIFSLDLARCAVCRLLVSSKLPEAIEGPISSSRDKCRLDLRLAVPAMLFAWLNCGTVATSGRRKPSRLDTPEGPTANVCIDSDKYSFEDRTSVRAPFEGFMALCPSAT
eukprot:scaffold1827_cov421-Prasinococcus_capsulatus_cf.AAC.15